MKKISVALASVVLLVSGCTQAGEPSAGEDVDVNSRLAEVLGEKTLQACTTGDYRPYTYKDPDTGEWSGIDIDMANILAESLDADIEFVQTSWGDLVPDFKDQCDIAVGGISYTTDRAQQVAFTDATAPDGKTPIVRCGEQEKYSDIDQINRANVRVITPIGGTNERFADKNFPDAEVIKFKDNNTIFDQIIKGDADVMVTDASETRWVQHEKPELCAVHPDEPFDHFDKGYLVPQGDTEWEEYVDNWLDIASQDGTKERAESKWFG